MPINMCTVGIWNSCSSYRTKTNSYSVYTAGLYFQEKKIKGENVPYLFTNFMKCQPLLIITACQSETEMSASQHKMENKIIPFPHNTEEVWCWRNAFHEHWLCKSYVWQSFRNVVELKCKHFYFSLSTSLFFFSLHTLVLTSAHQGVHAQNLFFLYPMFCFAFWIFSCFWKKNYAKYFLVETFLREKKKKSEEQMNKRKGNLLM